MSHNNKGEKMTNVIKMPDSEQVFKTATSTPVPGVSICYPTQQEMMDLKPFTGNRLFRMRVQKMLKHWQTLYPTHHIYGVVNIKRDLSFTLHGEDYEYNKGYETVDGNTRNEARRTGKLPMPEHRVICFVFDVDSADILQGIYDSYDSVSASKKTNEGIQSALETLGLSFQTKALTLGQFPTALQFALKPEGDRASVLEMVAYFKKELSFLDKTEVFDPEDNSLNAQIIKCMALIVSKLYNRNARCYEGLKRLAKFTKKGLYTQDKRWDGITAICYEYFFRDKNKKHFRLEKGFHCKTSFQMVEAQMDFLLYCFDKWMSDRPQDKENGFKSNTWQGVYKQTLQDMFDTYPFNN